MARPATVTPEKPRANGPTPGGDPKKPRANGPCPIETKGYFRQTALILDVDYLNAAQARGRPIGMMVPRLFDRCPAAITSHATYSLDIATSHAPSTVRSFTDARVAI